LKPIDPPFAETAQRLRKGVPVNQKKSEERGLLVRLLCILALCISACSTQAVILEWDRNPETNVLGYRVYTGRQSRVYDSVLDVSNQTLAELATMPGTTYYAVTAYDTEGLESDFSDEVFYAAPTVNSPPTAQPDLYTTTRNVPLNIAMNAGLLANDSDVDGDPLSVLLVTSVTHGALSLNANGSFSYSPTTGYTGSDSFSYRASDGQSNSAVAIVTISVMAAPNRPPAALADQYTTTKNISLIIGAGAGVLANDSDADGDGLVAIPGTSVSHGTLSFNANGSFNYTPAANFVGSDTFSYRVSDGKATSAVTVVTIIVTAPPNRTPISVADHYVTTKNTPLNVSAAGVLANDSDADSDPLVARLASSVSHGTLTLNASGAFNYTPAANYVGSDAFSYRVSDGKATSAVAVVTITVNPPPNSPPASTPDNYVTTKNTPLTISAGGGILANDSDADGDGLVAQLVSSVSHGTLSLDANGSFNYTPAPNFIGNDAFTYRASDSKATSAVTTVTIAVNAPPNTAPVSSPDQYVTTRNAPLNISAMGGVLANDSDADGDGLVTVLVAPVSQGTLSFSANGGFIYIPALNFAGSDSFSYQASDGKATSAVTVVSITVNTPPNSPPTAQADQYITTQNVPLNLSAIAGVLANDFDADDDELAVVLVESVSHGTLLLGANGSFNYTPEPDFVGTDSFSYFANDGSATSAVTVVTIIVNTLPNSTPTAQPDDYITSRNVPLSVAAVVGVFANDSDADGDGLVAMLVGSAANGAVSLSGNGSFIYTPSPNFAGTDSFWYQATDGKATSAVAVVTITVLSNSPPVARPDHYIATKNVPLSVSLTAGVLANDSDTDGDGLAALLVTSVTNGTLTLNQNGSFSYTLNRDFIGIDTFSYCAIDSQGTSSVVVVTIIVNASGNRVPIVQPEQYVATNNLLLSVPTSEGVLANDSDGDGDGLVAWLVTSPAHGTLSLNANGSFAYISAPTFVGLDAFEYRVTDGKATSAVAIVQITVVDDPSPPPPPPPPPPVSCFDCFAAFDEVLWRRSNAFRVVIPSRLAVPTNVTCPEAAVFVFGAVAKSLAAINDTEMNEALDSTAQCLSSLLKNDLKARLERAGTLATSKWTSTASNQVAAASRNVDRIPTVDALLSRARFLAAGLAALSKIDRTLAKGDLAPSFIANKVLAWDVARGKEKHQLRFVFGETSFVVENMAGTPVATGNYAFSRTAWNQGSLALTLDNTILGYNTGETATFAMKFSPARNRLTSQGLRGYFTID